MNTATLAVAGARKTQSIVEACRDGEPGRRRLVLTYTLSGQRDLERRLRESCAPGALPVVMGWYSFLLRHWIKPFLPLLYPGRRLNGLNFDGLPATNKRGIVIAAGVDRFLDGDSRAYKRFLSKLATDVAKAADGTVISRLQRMFDEIYVDEVQDLTGYDLDIVEELLRSTSIVHLVGDIRQSVFDTNPQDPRHKKFRGLGMLDWFKEQQSAGRLKVVHSTETWRSVQAIASFSDSLFEPKLGFPATTSRQTESSGHDGLFAISPADVGAYMDRFHPQCMRASSSTRIPDGVECANFGVSKGLTYQRVLIFPTQPMKKFLQKGTTLPTGSACGLYVGVTRAVYSVAFVVDEPAGAHLELWSPAGE